VTCICFDCDHDFYSEEPSKGLTDRIIKDHTIITDEEELQEAEDELKRQTEEDGDRRIQGNVR
jgi:hypothetical protein